MSEGPLVHLQAWPGSGTIGASGASGARGVLRALCEDLKGLAFPVSSAALEAAPGWEPLLARGRSQGCRWFVAFDLPLPVLEEAARHLVPGERLVFAAPESRTAERFPAPPSTPSLPDGPVYTVTLFGAPEITLRQSGDGRPVECRLRRSLQAFAYLASAPEMRANRDELTAAIWPNEGERTVDRNFHPTLSHLRRALEGEGEEGGEGGESESPILFRNGVYRLNPALGWCIDLREFLARCEGGRRRLLAEDLAGAAEEWRAAWRLYRGPFMQGFFDLWIAERREQLQQQYLDLLRDLGDLSIRLDRPEEALDAYRTVLSEDPLHERVQVGVMRLYAAQGRRDLVKRQYERLCALLVEELGVAPLPQTTEDYHRLMG